MDPPILSSVIPVPPTEVPLWDSTISTEQYFQVAILTALVYDAVITMDKEVKYFWRIKQLERAANIIYFMNRYTGIMGTAVFVLWSSFDVGLQLCKLAEWVRAISYWITIVSLDYILMIRVLALYSQKRALKLCLTTLLVIEAMFKLGVMIYLVIEEDVMAFSLAEGVSVCGIGHTPSLTWGIVDWTIPLVYGLVLMILALYKAAEYWRISAGFRGFILVKVLIQDQAIYFIMVLSCCVFNILDFKVNESQSIVAGITNELGSPAFLCILGSRMFFNIKEAGEYGHNQGTSYKVRSRATSKLEFA